MIQNWTLILTPGKNLPVQHLRNIIYTETVQSIYFHFKAVTRHQFNFIIYVTVVMYTTSSCEATQHWFIMQGEGLIEFLWNVNSSFRVACSIHITWEQADPSQLWTAAIIATVLEIDRAILVAQHQGDPTVTSAKHSQESCIRGRLICNVNGCALPLTVDCSLWKHMLEG